MKKVTGKSMKSGFSDFIEILKLNKAKINAVAGREGEGIGVALVYLIIGAVGAPLGGAILGYSYFGIRVTTPFLTALMNCVVAIVMAALVLYIANIVAVKLFKGKGSFSEYFRVMGYASLLSVVGFLTVVPFLSVIASIYMLVVSFVALKEVHKLDSTNAVLTILVTVGVLVLLSYLLLMGGVQSGMMGGFGSVAGYGMMGRGAGVYY